MALKFSTNLTGDSKPVIGATTVKTYLCKDFKGELSSVTGISSKFMYIAKLRNNFDDVISESPTINIICGPECIDKCINLNK